MLFKVVFVLTIIAPILAMMGRNDDEAGTSKAPRKKTPRGSNIDKPFHHPPSGERFAVEWSFDNQPVGVTGKLFDKKIAMLARRNELFPIDKKWVEQCPENMTFARTELEVCNIISYRLTLFFDIMNEHM